MTTQCRCGGSLVCQENKTMATIPTIMDRMAVCKICPDFGAHERSGRTVEGCGLLAKPCSVDKMRTIKDWTGPSGRKCWEVGETKIEFKKGRVGFLSPVYMPFGGTETWHQTLLPRLKGVVGFVSLNRELSYGDFSLLKVPHGIGIERARELATSVDVLVVWGIGGELANVLPPGVRPKVISVSHSDHRSDWTAQTMRAQAPWTDYCVYNCPSGIENVPKELRDKASCIPNGPDPARCVATRPRHLVRRDLEVPDDAKLLVVASRISPEKNIQKLMQAIECMGDGWHLRIAGKSSGWSRSHRGELRRYESERVKIIDPVKTPGDLLGAADASLSASEYEGYGLSSAEAMLAGVPVISTLTGLLEFDPTLAAIVPHNGNSELWAQFIIDDFSGPKLQAQRASKAKQVMSTKHSVDRFVSKWEEVIESVLCDQNETTR